MYALTRIFKFKDVSKVYNDYHLKIQQQIIESIQSNDNTMILDTETDGGNKIVQISYYIYDETNENLLHKYNFFLNDGTHTLDYFKKFDKDFIVENGIDVEIALNKLSNDFNHCKRIVCHNTLFDLGKLKKYLEKFNINYKFPDDVYCTMLKSRDIVKALDKNGRIKNPKLGELCSHLGVEYNPDVAHDGLYDVDVTWQCYNKLIRK